VPGYKLVAKRANRKWIDPELVESFVRSNAVEDYAYETKLRSVAQMEKVLKPLGVEVPAAFWDQTPSGYTIAPEQDPRPAALIAPEHEFTALPPGELAND